MKLKAIKPGFIYKYIAFRTIVFEETVSLLILAERIHRRSNIDAKKFTSHNIFVVFLFLFNIMLFHRHGFQFICY